MKEPIRSIDSNELPHSLCVAFAALAREAPSVETVNRVQRALQALPMPAAAVTVAGSLPFAKLLTVATLVAVAMSSTFVWKTDPELPATVGAQPDASEPPGQTSLIPTRCTPAIAEPAPATREGTLKSGAAAPMPSAEPAESAVRPRVRSRARPGVRPTVSVAFSAATTSNEMSVAALPTAPEQTPPDAVRELDGEAQRLAQCRRLAPHEPERALRELEALARDLPRGVFLEERELLEIRLHVALGHAETAAELSRRFTDLHPNSVYRRGLRP
jgi:hypothetical protein